MDHFSTINSIGHYCGHFNDGFWGEPQNSLSNLTFIIGAAYAWSIWRKQEERDIWQFVIIAFAASIGVGSFIFHSMPTRTTLVIDLIPIQIFSISYFGYVGINHLCLSKRTMVISAILFVAVRSGWITITPHGAFGGGITHIPALALLLTMAFFLHREKDLLAKYMLVASITYLLALVARCFDLPLCSAFPIGFHWLWHILTGLTSSILIYGIVKIPAKCKLKEAPNV